MNSAAETSAPATRPMAKLMSPCPARTSPTVTATPTQLSACSTSTRVRGARRCTIARGAVTTPLIRTFSATTRITPVTAGAPMAAARAGAPAIAGRVDDGAGGEGERGHGGRHLLRHAAPGGQRGAHPELPDALRPEQDHDRDAELAQLARPIMRASTRPMSSVPKRADAASMKIQPIARPIRLASEGWPGRGAPVRDAGTRRPSGRRAAR